ncbi:unnamed protein product [Heligmosomoides polygyrus]|uniref:Polyprotein n=1 Tax=Heligmosomoides polygyrus TaxID=6339 RepID=A0A3P8DE23_HELPZ|nr:unnamed protein product [Heligmosomoides polygyrus]
MIRSAEVLFMSPNKAICERQCGVLKKTPSLYKGIISRPHLLQSESAKQDAVESKLDRIIAYLTGFELRLQKIADRQMKMERDLASLTGAAPVFERYTPSESSSPDQPQKLDVRDRSVATPRPRKVLTYPYCLSKEMVDDLYRSKRSATAFVRAVERELFKEDADRDVNLDKRRDQGKVRWLRELVREWYPSPTFSAESTMWLACQIAINDYHRKKRKTVNERREVLAGLRVRADDPMEPCRSNTPEWEEPPMKLLRGDQSPPKIQELSSQFDDVKELNAADLL